MLLAAAGLGSGLFTGMVEFAGYSQRVSVGLTFGVALAAYFVWYERYRNSARMALFVVACTMAFDVSLYAVFPLIILFPINHSMSSSALDIPMPVFFGVGYVGTFIILAAGVFLITPPASTSKFLRTVALWSLGGGFLAVIGATVAGIYNSFPLLTLVWQPGVATLLGLMLEQKRKALLKP
jgi:hypothetical protein